MAEKKDAVVVFKSSALTSIGGTLPERIDAFKAMASCAASGLFPTGYGQVPQIMAACWFAEGLGVHPTAYMEGVQPVQFGGKTVREPKWEFINALLRSRLPGFDFTVHEETDVACEIEFFASGRKNQRVRYEMKEAVKQGLAGPGGRNRDTYDKNARKMLFKQCFKIGADRIGSDVLSGLPAMAWEDEAPEEKPAPTAAEEIQRIVAEAQPADFEIVPEVGSVVHTTEDAMFRDGAKVVPSTSQAFPAPSEQTQQFFYKPPPVSSDPETARARMLAAIEARYGVLNKDTLAERVRVLYNASEAERTGTDPKAKFTKAEPISPDQAEQVIAYLDAKKPRPEPVDEAPPADEAPPPERTAEDARRESSQKVAYDALMLTINRARKLFTGRAFMAEFPADSGIFWFTDQSTFAQAGFKESVKLQKAGAVAADEGLLHQLNTILAAACDEKERGGR